MSRYVWVAAILIVVFTAAMILAIPSMLQNDYRLPQPPLKSLAHQQGIQLGDYAARDRLHEGPYRLILTSQFGYAIIDGQPNWSFEDGDLRPGPNAYDFNRVDEVLRFAKQNNMPVRMHHFVWGEEKWLPAWLKNGDYNKEQLHEFIHDHIRTVGGRYKGQVREWSVVNEAFTRGLGEKGLQDWWFDHTGSMEYIEKSFTWAHEADPDAKLLLNDFNNEVRNQVSDAMYNYIKSAKERGVPIDGIGMQMHIDGSKPPEKSAVISNMQRFAELGVGVYVTEFDVNMNDYKGSEEQKKQRQGEIYYNMLRACIESEVCKNFGVLGITDKETWYNETGIPGAMPLPFDREYRPKPAFRALRDALSLPTVD